VRFRTGFMLATLAIGTALAVIMLSNPVIDLMLAHVLKSSCAGAGEWCTGWVVDAPRRLLIALFVMGCVAAGLLGVAAIYRRKHWSALDLARCWFLVALLAVGPGLVTNTILKDNWGRARPREVLELGGTKPFTPPLLPATACSRNCSFVSGEAASMFALFLAPALLVPGVRITLIGAAVLLGTAAGAIRMMQGAHFLSDVLFAGVFMALTIGLLHVAIFSVLRVGGPAHGRPEGAHLGASAE
jgi:lipid A 4'-phosphatase